MTRVLAACLLSTSPLAAQDAPNILLVIADDIGVYELNSYGEGSDPAVTPTLDALAAEGVLFRNVWSNPLCSPTRATIQTGRHGLQTGLGTLTTAGWALWEPETTVAEVLHLAETPYTNGYFGKWHLGNFYSGDLLAPNLQGYDRAVWTKHNLVLPDTYYDWAQVEDGVEVHASGYVTTHTVDRAIEFVDATDGPWFVTLAFHAAHDPFHKPPQGTYTEDIHGPIAGNERAHFKAMIEAMDFELGRFLAHLEAGELDAEIVFVGDNGSPNKVIGPPGVFQKSKGTVFEGGVNVPLIVAGSAVSAPGTECEALVQTTDLFATLIELAGMSIPPGAVDALKLNTVSVVPYLAEPELDPLRETVYAEWFAPPGFDATEYRGAVRNRRYKLRFHWPPTVHWLYDLETDPLENVNLLAAPLSPGAQAAYDGLLAELLALIATYGP